MKNDKENKQESGGLPLPPDKEITYNSQGANDRLSFIQGAKWAIEYILRMTKTRK
jgi:hypothetical protein